MCGSERSYGGYEVDNFLALLSSPTLFCCFVFLTLCSNLTYFELPDAMGTTECANSPFLCCIYF